jgi:hypothetical protein
MDEAVMNRTTGWSGNVKRQRHIGNFTRWKAAFDKLLGNLTNA